MADIPFSSLVGGGGDFKPSFFSGVLEIPAGVSGDILTLTAPEGKKIRLTALLSSTSSGTQTGVSIFSDGETVVNSLTLAFSSGSSGNVGVFVVGSAIVAIASGLGAGVLEYVEGSQIIINKSGEATSQIIRYSYAYGDYL